MLSLVHHFVAHADEVISWQYLGEEVSEVVLGVDVYRLDDVLVA
jgi:hypothetical protein